MRDWQWPWCPLTNWIFNCAFYTISPIRPSCSFLALPDKVRQCVFTPQKKNCPLPAQTNKRIKRTIWEVKARATNTLPSRYNDHYKYWINTYHVNQQRPNKGRAFVDGSSGLCCDGRLPEGNGRIHLHSRPCWRHRRPGCRWLGSRTTAAAVRSPPPQRRRPHRSCPWPRNRLHTPCIAFIHTHYKSTSLSAFPKVNYLSIRTAWSQW